jgi:hypothetical protein
MGTHHLAVLFSFFLFWLCISRDLRTSRLVLYDGPSTLCCAFCFRTFFIAVFFHICALLSIPRFPFLVLPVAFFFVGLLFHYIGSFLSVNRASYASSVHFFFHGLVSCQYTIIVSSTIEYTTMQAAAVLFPNASGIDPAWSVTYSYYDTTNPLHIYMIYLSRR